MRSALIAGNQLFACRRIGGVLSHRDNDRQRHAALARRAERRAGEIVDHLIEISVRHHHAVVLRPAKRLHTLRRIPRRG